jgi:hypothetical protein
MMKPTNIEHVIQLTNQLKTATGTWLKEQKKLGKGEEIVILCQVRKKSQILKTLTLDGSLGVGFRRSGNLYLERELEKEELEQIRRCLWGGWTEKVVGSILDSGNKLVNATVLQKLTVEGGYNTKYGEPQIDVVLTRINMVLKFSRYPFRLVRPPSGHEEREYRFHRLATEEK